MITTKKRLYEVIVVFNPNTQESLLQERLSKIEEIAAQNGGSVPHKEVWGRRSLAYPINNYKYGLFVVMNIQSESGFVNELNRHLRICDEVLRTSVVTKDEFAPDLEGRLKGDFTYGYKPPHVQYAQRNVDDSEENSDNIDDSQESDSEEVEHDGATA